MLVKEYFRCFMQTLHNMRSVSILFVRRFAQKREAAEQSLF